MSIKKTRSKTSPRGFSLLELLLVMALLPIVFFAVFSNFRTGFTIWTRVAKETPRDEAAIFGHKVRKDLSSMRRFASIPFDGGREEMSFAGAVEAPPELGGRDGIGRVRFFYDPGEHIVFREAIDYSQLYTETPGTRSVLLKNVSSFEMSYLSKDPLESLHSWHDAWTPDPKRLPAAVKFSFSLEGSPEKIERVEFVPAGGQIP